MTGAATREVARLRVGVPVATVWTSPEAPRDVDQPAVLDEPDVAAWTASMNAEVRKGLDGRTLTQLLLGEEVRVLEHRGEWVRVAAPAQPSSKHPRGYPGWVRRAHLVDPAPAAGQVGTVVVPTAACLTGDGAKLDLSFGTRLPVAQVTGDAVTVLLPDQRHGSLPPEALRLTGAGETALSHPAVDALEVARQFLGLRYLWGGTSGWGLDCSGLVHLVYRSLGVAVPRDAFDQADRLAPVALDAVEPGDLYFFARPGERVYHVGFASRAVAADGTRWMLHAPEGGELIEDAPLAPHRVETLVSAGRVLQPDTGRGSSPSAGR